MSAYAYYTVMLGFVTVLLFDGKPIIFSECGLSSNALCLERTAQNSLHTMLLVNFRRIGGLDAVLDICGRYADAIGLVTEVNAADRTESEKQELVHGYGGLKVALHLLYSLVSHKPSTDASANRLFTSKDQPETSPDYYEPHDLLVKMRLAVLPLIRILWQSPWLVSAPPGVSKYVIQCVLEIVGGDNEQSGADHSSELISATGPGLLRPERPDEDRIRQLTDMGFPRTAAVRALTRSHHNVSVATEFLLAHPYPFPADSEMDVSEDHDPAEEGAGEDVASTSAVESNNTETSPATDPATIAAESSGQNSESGPAPKSEGMAEDRRKELNQSRESLTSDIGPLALRLVDAHPSLIFDVRRVFTGPSEGYQANAVRCLVDDIKRFSPSAYDVHEEPLAVRCRLLALVLSDTPGAVLRVNGNNEQSLMDLLLALLLSNPVGIDKDQPAIPKWLAGHLLVTEFLLALGEAPHPITLPLASESIQPEELLAGPSYSEARSILFDVSFRLLGVLSLPRDELLATLRLLVQLTRDHALASEFVRRNGVALLLQRLKEPSGESSLAGCQSYIAIILRHVVEDKATLEHLMRQEVKRWFAQPRTRVVDVTNYVRNCSQMAARDPHTFVEVTRSLCQLLQPDATVNHITLKSTVLATGEPAPDGPSDLMTSEMAIQMQVDPPSVSSTVTPDDLETVVHFMVGELIRVAKHASENSGEEPSSRSVKQTASAGSNHPSTVSIEPTISVSAPPTTQEQATEGAASSSQDHSDFFYACFLMQCLTELLFSYDSCKTAFLSYHKKKIQTPSKDTGSRHKTTALNFLLSDLVSFGGFHSEPKFDARKRIMLCNWAMSVIVALCVDCSSARDVKVVPVDIASIRKTVLEAVSRSIKDAPPSESDDARYGRLLALADLCHRLLTVRFNAGANKPQEETPMHIAKIMLEKNFVATLTSVLSDIDLNYPNMRSLVTAILRPLEHLYVLYFYCFFHLNVICSTKIAIKMGRSTDKGKELPDQKIEDSGSASSEDADDEDMEPGIDREETPDVYRNSSLGMYAGVRIIPCHQAIFPSTNSISVSDGRHWGG